jgi:hypothetical protein
MRFFFILAALVAGAAARLGPDELRAAYERSAAACRHGHNDGVIVTLHEDAHPHEYMGKLRARSRDGDELLHHFSKVGRYVAARLSKDSLDDVVRAQGKSNAAPAVHRLLRRASHAARNEAGYGRVCSSRMSTRSACTPTASCASSCPRNLASYPRALRSRSRRKTPTMW